MTLQIEAVIDGLRTKRPIFHSEADFQHAFAWEFQTAHPDAHVRLEINVAQKEQHERLDILIRYDQVFTAIELKYKTQKLGTNQAGEEFRLLNHGAQDIGRYDFIKDIVRLEHLIYEDRCHEAYAIFMTNDPGYWNVQSNLDTNHAQFSLSEGRTLAGALQWGHRTGLGTMKNRESALILQGRYVLGWKEYSTIGGVKPSRFRYVIIPVMKQ